MAAIVPQVVCLISVLTLASLSLADNDHGSDAVSYDRDTFQTAISGKKHFVMFFAPWCGHCKRLAPTWNELAKVYNHEESSVTVAKVDCTVETALCSDHDVAGYPTLKFFHNKPHDFLRYKGNRDLESLQTFVEEQASRTDGGGGGGGGQATQVEEQAEALVELTDDTFESVVQEGFHFVKFYAPWCGHCKRLAPTWEELAKSFADSKDVQISKVDCTVSTKLCTDQGVRGYPTLLLFNNGDKVEQYQGSRSLEDLKSFVSRKVREASGAEHEAEEDHDQEEQEDAVVDLTDETFDAAISAGRIFVKFFAPWCGHCQRLAPTWARLGQANQEREVVIARVDCTKHQAVCNSQAVRGYPTLVMFYNGERHEHQGQRDLDSLQDFINNFLEHTEL